MGQSPPSEHHKNLDDWISSPPSEHHKNLDDWISSPPSEHHKNLDEWGRVCCSHVEQLKIHWNNKFYYTVASFWFFL
jgi:hypothetical protein